MSVKKNKFLFQWWINWITSKQQPGKHIFHLFIILAGWKLKYTGSFSLKKENFWEIVNEERDDRDRRTVPGEPAGQNRPVWLPDDRLCAVWEWSCRFSQWTSCTESPMPKTKVDVVFYYTGQPTHLKWHNSDGKLNSKSEYHQCGTWTVLAIWHHMLTL